MKLTDHFTLEELTVSDTAKRLGIDNYPDAPALENLKKLADKLETVRRILGFPLHVSSGYRSPKLNAAIPGSSKTSAHMKGLAADFVCPSFGDPEKIIATLANHFDELQFDQAIIENNAWVHIGFADCPRGQVMRAKNAGTANTVYEFLCVKK